MVNVNFTSCKTGTGCSVNDYDNDNNSILISNLYQLFTKIILTENKAIYTILAF